MNTFILIVILSTGYQSQAANSSISVEFESLEKCQYAVDQIVEQSTKHERIRILSFGCYEK